MSLLWVLLGIASGLFIIWKLIGIVFGISDKAPAVRQSARQVEKTQAELEDELLKVFERGRINRVPVETRHILLRQMFFRGELPQYITQEVMERPNVLQTVETLVKGNVDLW